MANNTKNNVVKKFFHLFSCWPKTNTNTHTYTHARNERLIITVNVAITVEGEGGKRRVF